MKFKNYRHDLGQELLEFAIILPVLLLILIGIFDLGRLVYYYSVLTNAAREGARSGIIFPVNQVKVKDAVCQLAIGIDLNCPNPTADNLQIDLLDLDGDNTAERIQVSLSMKFSPVTPLIGAFLDVDENNQISVSSQATMQIEN